MIPSCKEAVVDQCAGIEADSSVKYGPLGRSITWINTLTRFNRCVCVYQPVVAVLCQLLIKLNDFTYFF